MAEALLRAKLFTEAGPAEGLGHLTRCVALYDALASKGAECSLVVAGEAPEHTVGDRRVEIVEWRTPGKAARLASGCDIAVVDSYRAKRETYVRIASAVTRAVYFDDTARLAYPEGTVVNGSPAARMADYGDDEHHDLLLGPSYQVLRPEFWEPEERSARPTVERVLVVSGGTDAAGVRKAFAEVAHAAYPSAFIDVVDEPRTASEMRDAMREADLAVTTAGQTLYELAAMGTPTVAVCVASNQFLQTAAFELAGTLVFAGTWGEAKTAATLTYLPKRIGSLESRARMARRQQRLVDGRGALRVATHLVRDVVSERLTVEPAGPGDEQDLLELSNEPSVRAMSFSSRPIQPDEHHAWLSRTLDDGAILLLVARDGQRLVGQVRFDAEDDRATISISLAPAYRGLGLAGVMLDRAIDVLRVLHPEVAFLTAHVKPDNLASQRLFERAGFDPLAPEGDHATMGLTYERLVGSRTT